MAFSDGSGTELDPYLILTQADLEDLQDYAGDYFILGADIAMTGNWTPLTNWGGHIDGCHHRITNFTSSNTLDSVGFVHTNSSTLPLTIKRLEIHGSSTGIVTSSTKYCGYLLAIQAGTQPVLFEDILIVGKYTPGGDRGNAGIGIVQTSYCTARRVVVVGTRVNTGRGNSLVYRFSGTFYGDESYFNSTLCSTTVVYGSETPLTTAQFAVESNFPDLDFVNVWEHINSEYPTLQRPPVLAQWAEPYQLEQGFFLEHFVESYDLEPETLIESWLEPFYEISDYLTTDWYEPISYGVIAYRIEPYICPPILLTHWREYYSSSPEMLRSWREPISYASEIVTRWQEPWADSPTLLTAWQEPYRIADADLVASWAEGYRMDELNYLLPVWREPYAMTIGGSLYQRIERVN